MNVTVTTSDLVQARDEGTVFVVSGLDEDTRDQLTFGVDHRVFRDLFEYSDDEDGEVTVEVESWQVLSRTPCRRAVLRADSEQAACKLAKTVAAYLPYNYKVVGCHGGVVTVEGHDDHGWTLDGYVLPRLASGLMHAEEVRCQPVKEGV